MFRSFGRGYDDSYFFVVVFGCFFVFGFFSVFVVFDVVFNWFFVVIVWCFVRYG